MKLLIILSIISITVSGMRLNRAKTFGDTENFEYLGTELSFVNAEPDAVVMDSVTFPDDILENKFIIWGVEHLDFEEHPSNVTLSNALGSKSLTIDIESALDSAISSTFHFYGEKLP